MDLDLSQFDAITDDSRKVTLNSLFCAYLGGQSDGRSYIKEAIAKGASAILYEEADAWQPPIDLKDAVQWIPISNLRDQLGEIAAKFYGDASAKIPVIGITGTNGKTSCAQFIAQALDFHKTKCAVLGTVGNGFLPDLVSSTHTTLNPIELQKQLKAFVDQDAKAVAMEVSSHALEQGRVNGVTFETAVFTNLSRDHLDYHGSMETYGASKQKLFHISGLKYAVINLDDPFGEQLAEKLSTADVFVYSSSGRVHPKTPTVVATKIEARPDGFQVAVQTPWGRGEFETNLIGHFNISNLLAVLSVLCLSGVPLFDALYYLSKLTSVAGRMQAFGSKATPQVIVDYAHTPDALEKALKAVREHAHGKVICVFGCGGDRDAGKRPLMAQAAEQYADELIITNDNPRSESPEKIADEMQAGLKNGAKVQVILDREKAIQTAVQSASNNDIVLVAGKGHEDYQIINNQTLPFDDRTVAQQALRDFPS